MFTAYVCACLYLCMCVCVHQFIKDISIVRNHVCVKFVIFEHIQMENGVVYTNLIRWEKLQVWYL